MGTYDPNTKMIIGIVSVKSNDNTNYYLAYYNTQRNVVNKIGSIGQSGSTGMNPARLKLKKIWNVIFL